MEIVPSINGHRLTSLCLEVLRLCQAVRVVLVVVPRWLG